MTQHFTTASGSLAVDMDHGAPPERISLEIRRDKLLELLRDRRLCASDFRCTDCHSKHCVWRLMLKACGPGDDAGPWQELFHGGTRVFIEHDGNRYLLQITRQGKLILTK